MKGSLAHSHILSGPDGIGKSPLAGRLAHLMLDPNGRRQSDPVDLMRVRPQGKSIGVDEVRKITQEANIKPFEGNRKVILIHGADRMTPQAQNALLKTIEEPPEGVYFILLTDRLEALLPTIRSRCAIHRLQPLSRQELEDYLKETRSLSGDALAEVTAISLGIPGRADAFLDDPAQRQFYEEVLSFLEQLSLVRSLQDRRCLKILSQNRAILAHGPDKFFDGILLAIRDMARYKSLADYQGLIFLYNKEKIEKLAAAFTQARLSRITEICVEAKRLMEPGRNINPESLVDETLFRLVEGP